MIVTNPVEVARRAATMATGRIRTLPVLALHVHTACNCRCVMCDIWKANVDKRELSDEALERHLGAIRQLRVQRIMLTGGEPLLHSNLWRLCERLRRERIRLTLVTTGLLLTPHARAIGELIDEVFVSIDGPPVIHDAIRRVPGGYRRIAAGITALRGQSQCPRLFARSVVQKENYRALAETIRAVENSGVDGISFLPADVTSSAFNRPQPWPLARQQQIALSGDDIPKLADAIAHAEQWCGHALDTRFVEGGAAALWHIHDYYVAATGARPWPAVQCNAPWVSAVLEADGRVRPCFFHKAYPPVRDGTLDSTINSPQAIQFRRGLDVNTDATCQRCVCSLSLPVTRAV
jgi:MoaA/NifB/PqqE/SkfB family radical SAM enzyme